VTVRMKSMEQSRFLAQVLKKEGTPLGYKKNYGFVWTSLSEGT